MKAPALFTIAVLGMFAVLGWAVISGAPEGTGPIGHPDVPPGSMTRGQSTGTSTLILGWIFGFSQIIAYFACVLWGIPKGKLTGFRWFLLGIGLLGFLAIFSAMVFTNFGYEKSDNTDFALPFPEPSAWMMYGIWFQPYWFVALYLIFFKSWVIADDDLSHLTRVDDSTAQSPKDSSANQ